MRVPLSSALAQGLAHSIARCRTVHCGGGGADGHSVRKSIMPAGHHPEECVGTGRVPGGGASTGRGGGAEQVRERGEKPQAERGDKGDNAGIGER